jgi:hypothetical protein
MEGMPLGNVHLKTQERDIKIILKCILGEVDS